MANYLDTFKIFLKEEKITFQTPEGLKVNFQLLLSFLKYFTMFMENFSVIHSINISINIIHAEKI